MIASFRRRKDLVKAPSKASLSASNVFWAGGGIATFPLSERTVRILCRTFQARNRLCFERFQLVEQVLDRLWSDRHRESVHTNTSFVKTD